MMLRPFPSALAFGAVLAASIVVGGTGPAAAADTSTMGIALSNSYAGNTWRQQMLKTWDAATKTALKEHQIAKTKVVNSDNSAPQQATQIGNLILQGWQAIVIDAASPTALNGVIAQACRAKIAGAVLAVQAIDRLETNDSPLHLSHGGTGDVGRRQAAGTSIVTGTT